MKRKYQMVIAILFITATISYMVGDSLILSQWDQNQDELKLYIGIFLEHINSLSVVSIAIFFFSFLYHYSKVVALFYIVSRVIESTLLFIATLFPIIANQTIIDDELKHILQFSYVQVFQISMLSLSLGSVMLCIWLYRFSNLPRWLSILGVVGYLLLFLNSSIMILPFELSISNYLYLPGGFFEILFPIFLLVKEIQVKTLDQSAKK